VVFVNDDVQAIREGSLRIWNLHQRASRFIA
jgi:hypothetical protein